MMDVAIQKPEINFNRFLKCSTLPVRLRGETGITFKQKAIHQAVN